MHGLAGLRNSFSVSFNLKGSEEYLGEEDGVSTYRLTLDVDDFDKKYISEDDAREIFDLVTRAFILGNKGWHTYNGASYEFDRENLTIIERIDRNAPHRGEWL